MSNKKQVKSQEPNKNLFQQTIEGVVDVQHAYHSGLSALKQFDALKVTIDSPRLLDGSVDIDSSTKSKYPDAKRWDYVLSFAGKAFYVEVHPATNGEVKEIKAKKAWLEQWLREKASALNDYPSAVPRYYWIQSGKCGILKNSPEYFCAAKEGLLPQSRLVLKA